eukprot:2086405-Rhodomonas_salina.4
MVLPGHANISDPMKDEEDGSEDNKSGISLRARYAKPDTERAYGAIARIVLPAHTCLRLARY